MSGVSKLPGDKVQVSYPAREAQFDLTLAEYDLIRHFRAERVPMVKFVRGQYGLSLYEAKMVVDTIGDTAPI